MENRRIALEAQRCSKGSQSSVIADRVERLVGRLKVTDMDRYLSMCRYHLMSLLGSAAVEQLPDLFSTQAAAADIVKKGGAEVTRGRSLRDRVKRLGSSSSVGLFGERLNSHIVERLTPLISFLNRQKCLSQEGLFRKTGSVSRQRLLHDRLNADSDIEPCIESAQFSAHDCACVLKSFLGEMSEPLLTAKHYKAHCIIAEITSEVKRVQMLQLLFQLLPGENLKLLRLLLDLLYNVMKTPGNNMNAEALGTVFAPRILLPKEVLMKDVRLQAVSASNAIAFMIEKNNSLFQYPDILVQDIINHWQRVDLLNRFASTGNSAVSNRFIKHGGVTSTPKYSAQPDDQSTAGRSVTSTLKKLLTRARRNMSRVPSDTSTPSSSRASSHNHSSKSTKRTINFVRLDKEEEVEALIGKASCFVPSPVAFSLSPDTTTVSEPAKYCKVYHCRKLSGLFRRALEDDPHQWEEDKLRGERVRAQRSSQSSAAHHPLVALNSAPDQPYSASRGVRRGAIRRSAQVNSSAAPLKFRRANSNDQVPLKQSLKSAKSRRKSGILSDKQYISNAIHV